MVADCFASRYETSTSTRFGREDRAVPGLVRVEVETGFGIDSIDEGGSCEICDYYSAIFDDGVFER